VDRLMIGQPGRDVTPAPAVIGASAAHDTGKRREETQTKDARHALNFFLNEMFQSAILNVHVWCVSVSVIALGYE